jgi:hypothetical protein
MYCSYLNLLSVLGNYALKRLLLCVIVTVILIVSKCKTLTGYGGTCCNLSTQETKAAELRVGDQSGLQNKF